MLFKDSCTQNMLPKNSLYFKEEDICKVLYLPPQKPNIETLLDILVWPEVKDIKITETIEGTSEEGQNLTGVKLNIELKIKGKITYVANDLCQSVHSAHFEDLKSFFVILPKKINNRDVYDLVASRRINVIPYVESVYGRIINEKTIHKSILIFIDVKFC